MSLYIKTLGHFDRFQLNMWSGLAFSATYLVSSWMAPIWGKIADRHGRKKVMLISTIGDGAMVLCMAFVQHAYQLALFRLLQGFFAGYVANTSALIASEVPTKHSGKALSTLSTGTTGGMLVGPLFGGVIASLCGYRLTFFLTGLAYLIVFTLTIFFVKEHNFTPVPKSQTLSARKLFRQLEYPQVVLGMLITTLIVQAGNNSIAPVISLYVQQLLHGKGQVDLMSGLIAALPGIATIIIAPIFGEWGDRIGTQKILIGGLIFKDVDGIIYGMIINYIFALVVDKLMYGINAGKLALIVTTKGKEVIAVIDQKLERGATLIDAYGGYQFEHKDIVLCACSNKEMFLMEQEIKEVDNNAFTIILESNEVLGEGFKNLKIAQSKTKISKKND